jgi:hypothetical protein
MADIVNDLDKQQQYAHGSKKVSKKEAFTIDLHSFTCVFYVIVYNNKTSCFLICFQASTLTISKHLLKNQEVTDGWVGYSFHNVV